MPDSLDSQVPFLAASLALGVSEHVLRDGSVTTASLRRTQTAGRATIEHVAILHNISVIDVLADSRKLAEFKWRANVWHINRSQICNVDAGLHLE